MPATDLVLTLITQLVRSKIIGSSEIDAMAVELEYDGEEEAALMIRGAYIEAQEEPAHEWQAKRARAQFRVVRADGGNDPAP